MGVISFKIFMKINKNLKDNLTLCFDIWYERSSSCLLKLEKHIH